MSHGTRKPGGSRMSAGLVALGSAAVFAVYAAGFVKTKAAAEEFLDPRGPRRAPVPPGDPTGTTTAAQGQAVVSAPTTQASAGLAPVVTLALPTTPANRAPARAEDLSVAAAAATTAGVGVSPTNAAALPETSVAAAPTPTLGLDTAIAIPATPTPAVLVATPLPAAKYKDGTYTGWGSGRHGDIQAQVVVVDGRITEASIAQCLTRWSCAWVAPLPPQVPQRQSPEVDYVSGATQSTIAFYNALVDAIAQAKR